MNGKWTLTWIMLVTAGLSGCASMSSNECLTSDWAAIGFEDGARGYTTDHIASRRKACSKHGVTLDFAAYQDGREQGLVEFCQPGRGFAVGSNGGRYNGVCSAELEADFLDAYNAGYHLHALQSKMNHTTSAINSKENELDRLSKKMRQSEASLISSETTTEERVLLLVDLKEMSERVGQLEAEIEDLHIQRAYHQVELQDYQVALSDFSY